MAFNAVIVSGSSYDILNGTYIEDGIVNGKNKYSKDSDNYIFWYDDGEIAFGWVIQNDGPPSSWGSVYDSGDNVEFPWEVETWTDYYNYGAPTLTPIDTSAPSTDPIAQRDAKYATATESGSARFRRLVALGYV